MNKRTLLVLITLGLIMAPALTVAGDVPLGLRAGYTSWESLEQFHIGGYGKIAEVFPNWDIIPNAEFGFGDDVTLIALNGDLVYNFTELFNKPYGFYGGGELGLNIVDTDFGSDSDLGLSAVAGVSYDTDNGNQWIMEMKLGIMDSPGFKLTFGYSFF